MYWTVFGCGSEGVEGKLFIDEENLHDGKIYYKGLDSYDVYDELMAINNEDKD